MKRITIILFVILILCGCKKCIKSHEEEGTCIRYVPVYNGKLTTFIPIYYSCIKNVCDEYEMENENN